MQELLAVHLRNNFPDAGKDDMNYTVSEGMPANMDLKMQNHEIVKHTMTFWTRLQV